MYDFALVFSLRHACREPAMALTREQIASIAALARLDLTSAEIPVYQDSLSRILASSAPWIAPTPPTSPDCRIRFRACRSVCGRT